LNVLIAEVAYAISNIPKTIIQVQQPIIDLYSAELSSVHRGESSTSGWLSLAFTHGCLDGLELFAKRPSNLGMTYDVLNVGLC
jgi:hypothetical protein